MEKYLLSAFAFLLVLFISGCTQAKQVKSGIENFETPFIDTSANPLESPTVLCINLCSQQKESGVDFSKGPCLSDSITANWVCDVAHDPREDIDDKAENQCAAYNNGTARHFVEVNTNCNLIRTH